MPPTAPTVSHRIPPVPPRVPAVPVWEGTGTPLRQSRELRCGLGFSAGFFWLAGTQSSVRREGRAEAAGVPAALPVGAAGHGNTALPPAASVTRALQPGDTGTSPREGRLLSAWDDSSSLLQGASPPHVPGHEEPPWAALVPSSATSGSGVDWGLLLHPHTTKLLEGALGSVALYLGLQRAYLCLSQYETDCLGEERIQSPDSVPLNARKLWGGESFGKNKIIRIGWNLQEKCGGSSAKPKVRNKVGMGEVRGCGGGIQGCVCSPPRPSFPFQGAHSQTLPKVHRELREASKGARKSSEG